MNLIKDFFTAVERALDIPANFNPKLKATDLDIVKNIAYGPDPVCSLDTYCLKDDGEEHGTQTRPVLIYIHGGGFVAGDKEKRRGLATWYATLGFHVVNVNYGLAPECHYPAPLAHLVAALNWVIENAGKYRFDTSKIVAAGDSAGAYYAAALAALSVRADYARSLDLVCRGKIAATVLNCGLYDIGVAMKRDMPFELGEKLFSSITGSAYGDIENYRFRMQCSPINYIDASFPPSFVIYADKDIFCAGQAEVLLTRLHDHGVYHETFRTQDFINNHCFSLLWLNHRAQRANDMVASFLLAFRTGALAERIRNDKDEFEGEIASLD